jgi:cell division protein FtsQ
MWHRPNLLNALADLLYAAGAALLLASALLWAGRGGQVPALSPIQQVALAAAPKYTAPADLEAALAGRTGVLSGNFFTVSLDLVRKRLEALPWVRTAQVRRVWPDKLSISLEEQEPIARWIQPAEGDWPAEWVNRHGEVFEAAVPDSLPPRELARLSRLPAFSGPPGSALGLLAEYAQMRTRFAPFGLFPVSITLSARLALSAQLSNGLVLEIGRDRPRFPAGQRLARFVQLYPEIHARYPSLKRADLRYPGGFALLP